MFGFGKKKVDLHPPFAGAVIPVSDVPDPVFSQGMVGDGFAIVPQATEGTLEVCAPVAGKLVTVFPTLHAFALVTASGLEVLVHIGLDTVELKGEGFTAHAAKGETVSAGQAIVTVDIDAVTATGHKLITPVVMTQKKQVSAMSVTTASHASKDTVACTVTLA